MVERTDKTRHLKQEAEANRFSIELLAPSQRLKPFLYGVTDLRHALDIAEAFDISKAAAVRRYVELRDKTLAVIFQQGRHRPIHRSAARLPISDGLGRAQGAGVICFRRDGTVGLGRGKSR